MPRQVSNAATSSYRIPKQQVAVEIALRGGEPQEVSVFLHRRAASHRGSERPSDVLLSDEPFVPIIAGEGEVRLINKAAIAWMTIAPELEMSGRGELEAQLATASLVPIDITLDDGRTFVGKVAIVLPDANRRLQDFLNSAERFFEVRSARAVHFVNRDHVVVVKATE